MNKTLLGVLLSSVVISGCAGKVDKQAMMTEYKRTMPSCHSERECEVKWSMAREWVQRNTTWRIRVMTSDYMETFAGPPSPSLTFRVVKAPVPEGGYKFGIDAQCNSIFIPCHPTVYEAALDFNRTLNTANTY